MDHSHSSNKASHSFSPSSHCVTRGVTHVYGGRSTRHITREPGSHGWLSRGICGKSNSAIRCVAWHQLSFMFPVQLGRLKQASCSHTKRVFTGERFCFFLKGRTERSVYFDVSACAAPAEPALDARRGRAGFTGPSEQRGKTGKIL